jgi:hypothetical protein
MTKTRNPNQCLAADVFIRIWDFGFHSDFGFRISSFLAAPAGNHENHLHLPRLDRMDMARDIRYVFVYEDQSKTKE